MEEERWKELYFDQKNDGFQDLAKCCNVKKLDLNMCLVCWLKREIGV